MPDSLPLPFPPFSFSFHSTSHRTTWPILNNSQFVHLHTIHFTARILILSNYNSSGPDPISPD